MNPFGKPMLAPNNMKIEHVGTFTTLKDIDAMCYILSEHKDNLTSETVEEMNKTIRFLLQNMVSHIERQKMVIKND